MQYMARIGELNMENKKGFTLSEVLVVIALISVIMLVAIPSLILIKKKINKRLFEAKKELILTAAEQYAGENDGLFDLNPNSEITIKINDLIVYGYVESENNIKNCTKEEYSMGCIVNPETNEIINNISILITRGKNIYTAHWDEEINGGISQNILNIVCLKLQKENGMNSSGESCGCSINNNSVKITNAGKDCYFISDDPSNWIYYSEQYFRIMGIESIDGKYYVKIITQTPIQ